MKTVPRRGRRPSCFALCAALTLAAGCAAPRPELGASWFACSRDAQCTFMQDPTDCARFPINKRYASSFALHLTIDGGAALPGVECQRQLSDAPVARSIVVGHLEYLAICEEARCSSELRRNRRGSVRAVEPDLPKVKEQ
jgi:hypothetical protein